MKEIMVDLETMGSGSNAAIVSIGAVYFDPIENKLGETFYRTVSLKSSVESGGIIDPDTVMWWLKQSEEARIAIQENSVSIEEALADFAKFVDSENGEKNIWGNGAEFDNVILGNAYKRSNVKKPWSFKNSRCYRTIKEMNPDIKLERTGTYHNALDDAKSQAIHLMKILSKNKPKKRKENSNDEG